MSCKGVKGTGVTLKGVVGDAASGKARKTGASLASPSAANENVRAAVTDGASSFFSWHALPQGR